MTEMVCSSLKCGRGKEEGREGGKKGRKERKRIIFMSNQRNHSGCELDPSWKSCFLICHLHGAPKKGRNIPYRHTGHGMLRWDSAEKPELSPGGRTSNSLSSRYRKGSKREQLVNLKTYDGYNGLGSSQEKTVVIFWTEMRYHLRNSCFSQTAVCGNVGNALAGSNSGINWLWANFGSSHGKTRIKHKWRL